MLVVDDTLEQIDLPLPAKSFVVVSNADQLTGSVYLKLLEASISCSETRAVLLNKSADFTQWAQAFDLTVFRFLRMLEKIDQMDSLQIEQLEVDIEYAFKLAISSADNKDFALKLEKILQYVFLLSQKCEKFPSSLISASVKEIILSPLEKLSMAPPSAITHLFEHFYANMQHLNGLCFWRFLSHSVQSVTYGVLEIITNEDEEDLLLLDEFEINHKFISIKFILNRLRILYNLGQSAKTIPNLSYANQKHLSLYNFFKNLNSADKEITFKEEKAQISIIKHWLVNPKQNLICELIMTNVYWKWRYHLAVQMQQPSLFNTDSSESQLFLRDVILPKLLEDSCKEVVDAATLLIDKF